MPALALTAIQAQQLSRVTIDGLRTRKLLGIPLSPDENAVCVALLEAALMVKPVVHPQPADCPPCAILGCSVDEAAAALACSPKTCRRMIKSGRLDAHLLNGRWCIHLHDDSVSSNQGPP